MSMFEHAQTKEEYYELQEIMDNRQVEPGAVNKVQDPVVSKVIDTSFMAEGRCKDLPPSYMFARDSGEVIAAQEICKRCVVVEECLEYALAKKLDHGVWGGTSERERRKIIKQRRINGTT